MRVQRQRQQFAADARGDGTIRRIGSSERRLVWNGHWVMDERLDAAGVEVRIYACQIVARPIALAAVAKPADTIRQRGVTCDDGAAVPERSEILCRIKTERAGDADGADRTSGRRCQMRLTAVFDNGQVV